MLKKSIKPHSRNSPTFIDGNNKPKENETIITETTYVKGVKLIREGNTIIKEKEKGGKVQKTDENKP